MNIEPLVQTLANHIVVMSNALSVGPTYLTLASHLTPCILSFLVYFSHVSPTFSNAPFETLLNRRKVLINEILVNLYLQRGFECNGKTIYCICISAYQGNPVHRTVRPVLSCTVLGGYLLLNNQLVKHQKFYN